MASTAEAVASMDDVTPPLTGEPPTIRDGSGNEVATPLTKKMRCPSFRGWTA